MFIISLHITVYKCKKIHETSLIFFRTMMSSSNCNKQWPSGTFLICLRLSSLSQAGNRCPEIFVYCILRYPVELRIDTVQNHQCQALTNEHQQPLLLPVF